MKLLLFLALAVSLTAQEYSPINKKASKIVKLWDNGPPDGWEQTQKEQSIRSGGVTRVARVSIPTLAFYPVKKENAPSVIVCPGGGYKKLAYDKEGEEIAEWLNAQGFNAFLLKYRLPVKGDVKHIPPLQDAQRAASLIRSLASEMKLNSNKIGIMGFSAGGHLSALTVTAQERAYKPIDDIDKFSCEVNFGIFVYPAYIEKTKELFKLSSKTPPVYLMHAEDDKGHFKNSPFFHKALKEAGGDSTFNQYKSGGHGHGMRKSGKDADRWPEDLAKWLKRF